MGNQRTKECINCGITNTNNQEFLIRTNLTHRWWCWKCFKFVNVKVVPQTIPNFPEKTIVQIIHK